MTYLDYPPETDGWAKYFRDGTIEYGTDVLVDSGKASWTRGKQENMAALAIRSGDMILYLMADEGTKSKFWQSDDYEVVLGSRKPVRVVRRIEQKVGDKTWKVIEIDIRTQTVREFTSKHKI